MADGDQAFHFVMAGTMHDIGEADGVAGTGGFASP
jgi:hypothetical protein